MKNSRKDLPDKIIIKKRIGRRMIFISLCFSVGLASMIGKVAYIKIVHGEEFQAEVLNRMTNKSNTIVPKRGAIVDRNNKTLATSVLAYNIVLDPAAISSKQIETQKQIYTTLGLYLDVTAQEAQSLVEKNPLSKYALLAKNVPSEQAERLKAEDLSGVWFEEVYHRSYPKGDLAAQVIGFFNKDGQGQYGIEQQFDKYLSGTPGRIFSQLDNNQFLNTEVIPPVNGATVRLTVDEIIQEYTDSVMDKYVKEYGAANATAILMNPNNGEIYSMYSYPSFNPSTYNDISEQIGAQEWAKMSDVERSLGVTTAWQNHAIQHPYEHGSTVKPLFIAKAIDDGIISPNDTFQCNGYSVVANRIIHCWKRGGHGTQTLTEALANSCNTAVISISQKVETIRFQEYVASLGLGHPTNITLPNEASGLLHDKLGPVEKATYAMGQGFTATPIQLLTDFSAVINGGKLYEPYIVSEVLNENGQVLFSDGPLLRKSIITEETSDFLRVALQNVVNDGTGKYAQMSGYTIGGKTGTAQKLPRSAGIHTLSFVGYAPVEKPQIIALILLDEIKEGTGAPVKAFKEIMDNVLPYLEIEVNSDKQVETTETSKVPNITGMNLYEASSALSALRLNYTPIGVGNQVTSQYPPADTVLPKNSEVKAYMKTSNPEQLITTPDITNLSISEAREKLGADFNIVVGGGAGGKIVSQVPRANQKIDNSSKGTTIVVTTQSYEELMVATSESQTNESTSETD